MMSTTSSHKPSGVAGKMLKGAGLIKDEDASMRDLSRPGRQKAIAKKPSAKLGMRSLFRAMGGKKGDL